MKKLSTKPLLLMALLSLSLLVSLKVSAYSATFTRASNPDQYSTSSEIPCPDRGDVFFIQVSIPTLIYDTNDSFEAYFTLSLTSEQVEVLGTVTNGSEAEFLKIDGEGERAGDSILLQNGETFSQQEHVLTFSKQDGSNFITGDAISIAYSGISVSCNIQQIRENFTTVDDPNDAENPDEPPEEDATANLSFGEFSYIPELNQFSIEITGKVATGRLRVVRHTVDIEEGELVVADDDVFAVGSGLQPDGSFEIDLDYSPLYVGDTVRLVAVQIGDNDEILKELGEFNYTITEVIEAKKKLGEDVSLNKNCDIEDPDQMKSCLGCINKGGLWTAIGCVDPTPLGVITGLIRIAFGIMGGVALLQLIYAGIIYQSGDEAKIKEARGKVISTITGIAVLVFSVLILRVIGVNVLDVIPSGVL